MSNLEQHICKEDISICDNCNENQCQQCADQYMNICEKCFNTGELDYCKNDSCGNFWQKDDLIQYNGNVYCELCIDYIKDEGNSD